MDVKVTWVEGMELTGWAESGHEVSMDASEEHGGQNKGFRPVALLAVGAAGCAGLDVISILRKKRVSFSAFECKIHVVKHEEDHPHVFTKMHFDYIVTGRDIKRKDVERSVQLIEERYCQAIAMLSKTAEITHTITIIEE